MKAMRFLAAVAALALVACGPDTPDNEDGTEEGNGLKVTVSTYTIAADGEDAAQFSATFDGATLQAADLSATVNGEAAELPELKFTTTTPGTYTIQLGYKEHKSDEFQITAVKAAGLDLSPIEESGMSLRATTTVFQKGVEECLLIVRRNGEVLDPEKVTFYYALEDGSDEVFTVETKEVTDVNGGVYNLAIYNPSEVGTKNIWIARNAGPGDTRERLLTITAVDFAIPSRAIDSDPSNTNFSKRMFVTQFTGTECGYCPFFIAALHTLADDPEYGDKFVLAAVHTYSTTDPMYPQEFNDIDRVFGVNGYPTIICDMKTSLNNNGYETNMKLLRNQINTSLDEAAKAGISAKINYEDGLVVARVSVKAAEAGNYRVGAWLVEDGIHAMQYNNGCKVDIDFSTHEAAVRIADSKPDGERHYAGHSLGSMAAGDIADYVFVMNLKQSGDVENPKTHWVAENCRLVFFVTAESAEGTYVTNVVENENLTQTITFDYK
ncbi:MAG: Omp28-related outer membrane protein [Tidjanibacter sp.]|nr:Omp28-related outer membrane protein [Tidjanibacter sp.]